MSKPNKKKNNPPLEETKSSFHPDSRDELIIEFEKNLGEMDNIKNKKNMAEKPHIKKLREKFMSSVELQKFSYYVKPFGEKQINSNENLSVLSEIHDFLNTPHKCSLLVLGDSGHGKSLLGQYLVWELWNNFEEGNPIPLFIHLPLIPSDKRSENLLQTHLKSIGFKSEEVIGLLQSNQFILILDGYDEIPEIGNLYLKNHWHNFKIKMITTCRSEALLQRQSGNSYQELFLPKRTDAYTSYERYKELYLKKFNLAQIDLYLKQYIQYQKDQEKDLQIENWEKYREQLDSIPGLLELVTTPFILSMVVQVLPQIVDKYQSEKAHERRKLMRTDIYDYFVDYWFDYQVGRLQEQGKLAELLKGNLKEYLKTYSQNLASRALCQGQLEITIAEKDTLNPELLLPRDEKLMSSYQADFPKFSPEIMASIRSGCLLKTGQEYFSFLHKSLVEYFAAHDLFTGVHLTAEWYAQEEVKINEIGTHLSLNDSLLINEPSIIHILADRVETDPIFKTLLYDVIELSKTQPLVSTAAANAITILNVSGESFSTKNFKNIRIPGANLAGAICDKTNFEKADLTGVCFSHAWLRGSNFSKTTLRDIDFTELPSLENDNEISSICVDPNGAFILIADEKGYLTQWSCLTGKREGKYLIYPSGSDFRMGRLFGFSPLTGLAISPDGKLAAVATFDGVVHLWDVNQKIQTKQFLSEEVFQRDFATPKRVETILFVPPDGRRIIFGGQEIQLQMLDTITGQCLVKFDKKFGYEISVSSDGKMMASGSWKHPKVYIFNLSTNLLYPQKQIDGCYLCFSFSPSGRYFGVFCLKENSVQLLSTKDWRCLKTIQTSGRHLNFSPDEQLLVILSLNTIRVFHVESGKHLYDLTVPTPTCHKGVPEISPFFIPNKRHLYCPIDSKIYVWSIQTAPNPLAKRPFSFSSSDFPKANHIMQRSYENKVSLIKGELEAELRIENTSASLTIIQNRKIFLVFNFKIDVRKVQEGIEFNLLLSPNKRYIVFSYCDVEFIETYHLREKPIFSIIKFGMSLISDLDARVFDLQRKELVHSFRHQNQILSMKFSTDSKWLITAEETVRIWDIETGNCLHKFKQEYRTESVALSSKKEFIAIADGNQSLKIYKIGSNKCICSVSRLATQITKLDFSIDDKYLLGVTHKGHLLFRFNFRDTKSSLNLVNGKGTLTLNCFEANITDAYGLSPDNQLLLKQRGALGNPSTEASPIQESNNIKKVLMLVQASQPVIKVSVYSIADPKIPITYDNWVVSIMRKPTGDNPDHAFLMIEGIDQLGKGLLARYDLVNDKKKPGYALIVDKCLHDIPPKDIKTVFCRDIMKQETFFCKSWSISRQKAISLLEDMELDKSKEIKYFVSGKNSIFVKSMSNDGHSCFTWAREKLYNLDDKRIKKDLPEKWSEFVAAKTSFYIEGDNLSWWKKMTSKSFKCR